MNELKSPVFINYLGEIPINPDDLPRPDNQYKRSFSIGPGTDRPVGLGFNDMAYLYWKVRSFQFTIDGILPPRDMFTDFFMSGGTSGGVTSALGGLAGATALGNAIPDSFGSNGFTKIEMVSRVRNRIKDKDLSKASSKDLNNINLAQKPDLAKGIFGDPEGPYAEKIIHYRRNKNNKKTGEEYRALDINEGSLPAAGPVHKFFSRGCGLIIDFSYIVKYRYMYYPRIIILTPWGNSFLGYSSEMETQYGLKSSYSLGYSGMINSTTFVSFRARGAGIIPIYYFANLQLGQTGLRGLLGPLIKGTISIDEEDQAFQVGSFKDQNCCTKFYYDGSDEYRKENSKECKTCDLLGVGLKA